MNDTTVNMSGGKITGFLSPEGIANGNVVGTKTVNLTGGSVKYLLAGAVIKGSGGGWYENVPEGGSGIGVPLKSTNPVYLNIGGDAYVWQIRGGHNGIKRDSRRNSGGGYRS